MVVHVYPSTKKVKHQKSLIWQQQKHHLVSLLVLILAQLQLGFCSLNVVLSSHVPLMGASPSSCTLLACLPPPPMHFMKQLSYFTSCLLSQTTLPLSTNLSCHYENSPKLKLCTPASGNRMAPLWATTWVLYGCECVQKCDFEGTGEGGWVIARRWLLYKVLDRSHFQGDRRSFQCRV